MGAQRHLTPIDESATSFLYTLLDPLVYVWALNGYTYLCVTHTLEIHTEALATELKGINFK